MKRFLRDNGLSLTLGTIFLLMLTGQAFAGWLAYNEEQRQHGELVIGLGNYLTGPHFWEAVFENWESEFLQMGAYVLLTAFLFQRGSAESNDPDEPDQGGAEEKEFAGKAPGPVCRGGWRLKIYENSLSLALFFIFFLSFVGHVHTGALHHNEENLEHGREAVSAWEYVQTAQFWFESLQNWQSEFLAVLGIVVLSIWLRQKGSSESKQVTAPHSATGKSM